ncbi:MAG: hypothetical protein AAF628_01480 [Planctomycetota bacterium]
MPYRFIIACLTLSASVVAQSGSASFTSLGDALVTVGGRIQSLSMVAETESGAPFSGQDSSSPSYTARGGIAWLEPIQGSGPPLVFQVLPGEGRKGGGDPVRVIGFNFLSPGSVASNLLFDGVPAPSFSVVTDSVLTATTPGGIDACGNPKGLVEVRVDSQLGTGKLANGFGYQPILRASSARVGQRLDLQLSADGPTSGVFWVGQTVPGVCVPIAPFAGSLTLVSSFTPLGLPPLFSPTGQINLSLVVPADPLLVGLEIEFQALAVTPPPAALSGSFTRALTVPVLH